MYSRIKFSNLQYEGESIVKQGAVMTEDLELGAVMTEDFGQDAVMAEDLEQGRFETPLTHKIERSNQKPLIFQIKTNPLKNQKL